jgi:bis(5'-nucleosidyl)-tetraphosphatase
VSARRHSGAAPAGATLRKRAAGAVVVRAAGTAPRYLVLRAFRNWDFPKGVVEPDESPLAAAQREVLEETSLAVTFPWGTDFRETEPYAGGKVARFYVAAAPDADVVLPVSAELGRPEHHEFRWATYPEAHALLPPRLQSILAWARTVVGDASSAVRTCDRDD